jgi:hypothetical protein
MVAQVGASNVSDMGCACNLEMQATSVDDLEFSGCRSVVAECVHQLGVLLSVCLRFDGA